MGKKIMVIPACGCSPAPYDAKEMTSRFKKDYEFRKAVPARSPVSGWERNHIVDGDSHSYIPKQEVALVKGSPHKFKGLRTGSVYGSRKAVVRSK